MTLRRPEPVRQSIRAAIYCRISLARHGDTVKVDDQETLCRKVAGERTWQVDERYIYKDNSQSAWRRDRKRPQWDAMLDAVERGEIDAIIVYHGDRLIRQPWDLELLLRLADDKGIHLASPTGTRNLDNPDDRFILRIEAAQACRESDNTSRRLRWHYEKQADRGVVRLGGRGGRAFGFEPDGLTHRDDEVAIIRAVARRILAGEPISAIARDINGAGARTTPGNEWDHGSLKKLMCRPRLAGLVSHHGQIIGPATWAPILERDQWEAVVAALEHKAGTFDYATNARRYQLTGIATCGPCSAPLAIRHNTRSSSLLGYGCINRECRRKVHRSVQHLDDYLDGVMVGVLSDERIRQRLATPVTRDLTKELHDAELHKEALLSSAGDVPVSAVDAQTAADILRVTVRKVNERIDGLRQAVAAAQVPHTLDGLWGITLDGWRALPLARRRAAISAAVTVTVWPARRGPGFDPATVKVDERI